MTAFSVRFAKLNDFSPERVPGMNAANSEWKETILDHYKNPRAYGEPAVVYAEAEEHNRTCGDHVKIFLGPGTSPPRFSLSFTGAGCSLCIASASLMCGLMQNVLLHEAETEYAKFNLVWANGTQPGDSTSWEVVAGLRQYPVRSRCVKLPWQALEKIMRTWPPATSEGELTQHVTDDV